MRSGVHDPDRDWNSEYYEINLELLSDFAFVQERFRSQSALVARKVVEGHREEIEYAGQAYDETEYELIDGHWDHYHCKVCDFVIDDGYTYWKNGTGMVVCDVCHDYIDTVLRPGRESASS